MAENGKQAKENLPIAGKDEDSDLTWAALCHFSALLGIIWWIPAGPRLWLPFGHLLSPLVVWLLKRKESPFINEAGKESLNFQLMMTLYGILYTFLLALPVDFPLIILLVIVDVILVAIAGVEAGKGKSYRYPLVAFRLIR